MCASVGFFSSSISWPDADRENSMASPGEFKHPDPEGGLANEHVLATIKFNTLMKNIPIPGEARP